MAEGTSVFYLPSPYGEGTVVLNAHDRDTCRSYCALHRPSAHWAVDLPLEFVYHQEYRYSALYRICRHGNLHVDPDDHRYRRNRFGHKTTLTSHRLCQCECCPYFAIDLYTCYPPASAPMVLPPF